MKQHLLLHDLIRFLNTQKILLNSRQTQQLEIYHSELRIFADKMNLISSGDKHYIIERHFLSSFYYLYYLLNENRLTYKRILDLGTGAGFPGIILAIVLPDAEITLIDSSRKKTLFLKNLIAKLGLKVGVVCERIENLNNTDSNKFDIIVARAVTSIPNLVDWCMPFLKRNGFLLTLKGDNYNDELKGDFKAKFTELSPESTWTSFSDYLKNKRMLKIYSK